MARMSVDDSALRDPRIARLSRALAREFGNDVSAWPDFARRYALGTLLDVWAVSYDRKHYVVSADDIDMAALIDGFHATMVANDLGTHERDGIAIRGARKRVAYLIESEETGREAGKKSGRIRREKAMQRTTDEGFANIPDTSTSIAMATVPEKRRRGERAPGPDGYQDCVGEFDRMYRDDHGGAGPTWNAKNGSIMSRLVKAHGRDEVIRRIRVLFTTAPTWIESRDMATLSAHFDKLAAPARERVERKRDTRVGRYEPPAVASDDDTPPWELP